MTKQTFQTMHNDSFNFEQQLSDAFQPLAAILRPQTLADYIGQSHILKAGSPLKMAIEQGHCHSLIFWGPPGTGKTTLAEIIARHANAEIERLSAVTSGMKEIRQAIEQAKQNAQIKQRRTVLFVDEVHRFNKSQQDAFLPYIEDGTIVFIGATTENPAFELNKAILSRARVYSLKKLTPDELSQVLQRAKTHYLQQENIHIQFEDKAQAQLIALADGDARRLLNLLENCLDIAPDTADKTNVQGNKLVTLAQVIQVAGDKIALYDKGGDAFYDLISAFHKSIRGSSADGALYWYARILIAGGDPLYVARRLLAIASEDIGNADPRALEIGLNAWDIFQRVGPAEGERAIAQAAVYMALAPKSNAVYTAFKQAKVLAKETSSLDVPLHLKNATSSLTESLGHGVGYRYAHNEEGAYAAGENYFPPELANSQLYQPTDRGLEQKLQAKLAYLQARDRESNEQRY